MSQTCDSLVQHGWSGALTLDWLLARLGPGTPRPGPFAAVSASAALQDWPQWTTPHLLILREHRIDRPPKGAFHGEEPYRRAVSKRLTKHETRRVAADIVGYRPRSVSIPPIRQARYAKQIVNPVERILSFR
jgi:hypothetical protein